MRCSASAFCWESMCSATVSKPERLAQLHHHPDERVLLAGGIERRDERAVDLELVDRQPVEVGQRAVAGAEVVDRDPHAQGAELVEGGEHAVLVADEHRLRDLEGEELRAAGRSCAARAVTAEGRSLRSSWRPDTLTATPTPGCSACHAAASAVARCSIHSPIGTIRPVSSATSMNSSGWHHAVVRAEPADQRLLLHHPTRPQLDDGLVHGQQLVALEGALQRRLESEASGQLDAHGLVEPLDLPAAPLLGAVHRRVGVPQQLHARLGVAPGGGDADRRGDEHLVAAHDEGLSERELVILAAMRASASTLVRSVAQHDELVTAGAGEHVARVDRSPRADRRRASAGGHRRPGRGCR